MYDPKRTPNPGQLPAGTDGVKRLAGHPPSALREQIDAFAERSR